MTDKFDIVGVLLVVHKEGGEDANALQEILQSKECKQWFDKMMNTVWGGGILEWPPGAVTSTRTFKCPFSAIPGLAMMEPNSSTNPTKTKDFPFSVKYEYR